MNLEIPSGPFDGAIFDCDGTLVDTMPIHYQAWLKAFKQYNAPFHFEEDFFYHLGGTSTEGVVEILNKKYGVNLDPATVAHDKEAIFLQDVEAASSLPPIEEVIAFSKRFKEEGKPVAVVSGGMRHVVDHTLDAIGLGNGFFPVIITPEDVPVGRGKPQPDMFLLAAKRIGIEPSRALVFEDAPTGIAAAKAAGMACVVVPRPH